MSPLDGNAQSCGKTMRTHRITQMCPYRSFLNSLCIATKYRNCDKKGGISPLYGNARKTMFCIFPQVQPGSRKYNNLTKRRKPSWGDFNVTNWEKFPKRRKAQCVYVHK